MINPGIRKYLACGCTLALTDGRATVTYGGSGISPLYELYRSGRDIRGWSAADKIVGRAAAMLYLLLGVREVYAEVMSEDALTLLRIGGVCAEYGTLCRAIVNRAGTGVCPMERAVSGIDVPEEAARAIGAELARLARRSG